MASTGEAGGQACFLVSSAAIRMATEDCVHLVAIDDEPQAVVGPFVDAEGHVDVAGMARALRELEWSRG